MHSLSDSRNKDFYEDSLSLKNFKQEKFIEKLKKRGQKRLERMMQYVHNQLYHDLELGFHKQNTLILTTWSDGRRENIRDASGVEIMLYVFNQSHNPYSIGNIVNESLEQFNIHSVAPKLFGTKKVLIEHKSGDNAIDSEYMENPAFFPTRFLDSYKLYGGNARYEYLKNRYFEGLSTIDKKQRKSRKSRIRYHKNISFDGIGNRKGKPIEHFSPEQGYITYGKEWTLEYGIKHWPLRYLQYQIMQIIIDLVRNWSLGRTDLTNIHWFVKDKIEFLRNFDTMPTNEAYLNDLVHAYYYFLRIHHILQKKYKSVPQTMIRLHFDEYERQEFIDTLRLFNARVEQLTVS